MKILFIQNVGNVLGGISSVNNILAKEFAKKGYDVKILSVRNSKNMTKQKEIENVEYEVINESDIWDCPRYSEAIKSIKDKKIVKAINLIIKRFNYDIRLNKDLKKFKKEINKYNPDYIINSHYELLYAIDKKYLNKTINHYHTNFKQVLENKSQIKCFNKFKNKLYKFIWLTEKTKNDAIEFGIENSISIYNPTESKKCKENQEESEKNMTSENKKLIFLGRFSEEKRLDLCVKIVNDILIEKRLNNVSLDIYGIGEIDNNTMNIIDSNPNINYLGIAKNPNDILENYDMFLMTSSFEGFPLTVLEANKNKLPVIAFDFGESINEVIKDNETGIIVENDNIEEYKEKLIDILQDNIKREEMIKKAHKFSKKFLVDEISKQWYELLKNN